KGEKLTLWSAIKSDNYVYLMEYSFTDDGRIVCRLGFTAHNLFDRAKFKKNKYDFALKDEDIHAHVGCWRWEFDLSDPGAPLGGPKHNELKLVRRVFEKGAFRLDVSPFPGDAAARAAGAALEGKAKWVADEFTVLRAESTQVKNGNGKPIA